MLSIIIPVYNERRTLAKVLVLVAQALAHVSKEIIVVDDGSNDGTRGMDAIQLSEWPSQWINR